MSAATENRMRLQRFLARAGAQGRRKCEEAIAAGRVCVNGQVVTQMGVQVDPTVDVVTLDGRTMALPAEQVVLALNKPAGCFTTMHEQRGRACVADCLPMERYPALYHVGRLDRDTTGILLFATDGDLGNALLHPSRHVDKVYIAQVKGTPTQKDLDVLRRGVTLRNGDHVHRCAPAQADLLKKLPAELRAQDSCLEPGMPGTSFVRIEIHEGIKHQVKLMLAEVGHPVVRLHRAQFGPISCGALKQGEWRLLEPAEVASLQVL